MSCLFNNLLRFIYYLANLALNSPLRFELTSPTHMHSMTQFHVLIPLSTVSIIAVRHAKTHSSVFVICVIQHFWWLFPQPHSVHYLFYIVYQKVTFPFSHKITAECRMKNVMWIGNHIIAIAASCLLYVSFNPQCALITLYCLLILQQGCTAWKEFEGKPPKEKKPSACRFDFMRLHSLRSRIQFGKSRRRRKLWTGTACLVR